MLIKPANPLEKYLLELVQEQGMIGSFEHAFAARITTHQQSCVSTFHDFASLLDDTFGTDPNVAVFHDLRLQTDMGVGQIDHLLVTRYLDVFIIESRHYGDELRVTEQEEFIASYTDGMKIGIRSPVNQLRRNLVALQAVFKRLELPKKFGEVLIPEFHRYVVLNPETKLINQSSVKDGYFIAPKVLVRTVYKAAHRSIIARALHSVTPAQLKEMMRLVSRWHAPTEVDFISKYRATAVV